MPATAASSNPKSPSTKQMREERAKLATTIRELADKVNAENRDFTAEEKPNWEKVNADYDALTRNIERAQRAEAIEAEQTARAEQPDVRENRDGRDTTAPTHRGGEIDGGPSQEHRALALQAWCRAQSDMELTEAHVEAARECGLNPNSRAYRANLLTSEAGRQFRQAPREKRALSAFVSVSGGYTVPQGFVNTLEEALLAYANVRQVADVLRTESGNDLPWPTVNDTSNKGAILVEAQNVSTNVQPLFGQLVLHAYKYTSGLVQVPTELLQDSAFDLAAYLASALGTRIGRIQADHFTFGTGASQPNGFANAAAIGITAASSIAIAADEIYGLKHSVDPAYRPQASWMFHDQILLYIKKLKDGNGRYLWQSSLADGVPDTLDGQPITINQSMANAVATGNLTMAYGAFSKYKIRDVAEVRMLRLIERYADQDMTGFVMFTRSDGNLIDAGTHPIKTLKQP